eukprot:CAMPEP_0202966494 /NCGR_PEP_ID=MMETSP1396-20130829/10932_1 /ASSEMBLY_ACC=CAM_ASM_000872 /TAXON_ID= /ORGANISM="Pseudokeronopsis sp., Strain Brazil" /LENGTH=43 /DNA_ID= /DNA_START= /DNA_END= /DNA_ORIENTATION=
MSVLSVILRKRRNQNLSVAPDYLHGNGEENDEESEGEDGEEED